MLFTDKKNIKNMRAVKNSSSVVAKIWKIYRVTLRLFKKT